MKNLKRVQYYVLENGTKIKVGDKVRVIDEHNQECDIIITDIGGNYITGNTIDGGGQFDSYLDYINDIILL